MTLFNKLRLSNLLKRTLSGIIYLVIIIGAFFLGKYAYGALFLMVGILALIEYYHLTGIQPYDTLGIGGMVAGAFLFVLSFLVSSQIIPENLLSFAVVLPVIALVWALYQEKSGVIAELSKVFLGILYIIVPLSITNYLVFPADNGYMYTHRIALGILALVWINDTGAYVSGMLFGRHKLFPRISPKKSWEGLIGGTIFTFITALWMDSLMGILTVSDWIFIAGIVSVFGIFGDLTESLLKRNAGRKDSGDLIPGHGGVLDRFDSFLFVIPATFVYLMLSRL